jgi:WD40 repeat protein
LFVAAGFASGIIIVWDGDSGSQITREMTGHESDVTAVVIETLNNRPVIISGGGGGLRRWDIFENQLDHGSQFPSQNIIAATALSIAPQATSEDRAMLAAGTHKGAVHLLDLRSGGIQFDFQLAEEIQALAFHQFDGRTVLAAATMRGWVQVWDLATGVSLSHQSRYYDLAGLALLDIAVVDDKLLVAFISDDNKFRTHDIETGQEIGPGITIAIPLDEPIEQISLTKANGHPIGILQVGNPGIVHVYDILERRLIKTINTNIPFPSKFAIGRMNGRTIIVTLCEDLYLYAIDVITGEIISKSSTRYESAISTIAAGELGGRVVVVASEWGSDGGTIRMWRFPDLDEFFHMPLPVNIDVISIQEPFVLIGGEKGILCLRIDPS